MPMYTNSSERFVLEMTASDVARKPGQAMKNSKRARGILTFGKA